MIENGVVQWIMAGGMVTITSFSIATYIHVSKVKDEGERKRGRIYERLDEVKKNVSEKFVSKDIFQILYEQLDKDITEIKTDVKLLLRKNGIKAG